MCEPLKGKIEEHIAYGGSAFFFDVDDVKSAVEGFFKELFEERENDGNLKLSDYIRLKKKWFPDVIE